MKYALCQINTTIGDFVGNTNLILDGIAWARAQAADVAVFPECAITGYPPSDLLENPDFIERNLRALAEIERNTQGIAAIVGYVDRNPDPNGRPFLNAAAVLANGARLGTQAKTLLPTYDVFDEGRYFEPATEHPVFQIGTHTFGISICEDCWATHPQTQGRCMYPVDPMKKLALNNAELVVNISASPFAVGKAAVRRALLKHATMTHGYHAIYVNQVGGNGQLVFDGQSMAVNAQGKIVYEAPRFVEHRAIIDDAQFSAPEITLHDPAPIEKIYAALRLGLHDYVRKSRFQRVLVGSSGGIDSAVVACLAADALGAANVTTVAMPSRFSSAQSLHDATALAKNLGVAIETHPIDAIYQAFRAQVISGRADDDPDLAEENLQARIRGTLLMTLSNRTGALLLSTGNKSELAVGYCTLYGDMNGGLAPLSDVYKTNVFELARLMNRTREVIPRAILERAPSAELRPNQADQQTLPPYDTLDRILKAAIEEQVGVETIVARGFDRALVERILCRMNRAEYKRQQAAPGIKLSNKAFGMGRRIPVVNLF